MGWDGKVAWYDFFFDQRSMFTCSPYISGKAIESKFAFHRIIIRRPTSPPHADPRFV